MRTTLFRGSVVASAYLFDTRSVPEDALRLRILGSLHGVTLFRHGPYLVATLPRPERVETSAALGVPLVLDAGQRLVDAPLAGGVHPPGAVVITRGEPHRLDTAAVEDASTWLDLSSITALPSMPLGAIEAPSAAIVPKAPNLRAAVGLAELSASVRGTHAALLKEVSAQRPPANSPAKGRLPIAFHGWLRAFLVWAFAPAPSSGPDGAGAPSAPPMPHKESPLLRFLRRAAASLVAWTGLGSVLSMAQRRFLRALFEALENDDVDEILRRAIPLAKPGEGPTAPPALLPPTPRTSLAIRPSTGAVSSSLSLEDSLFQRLRTKYLALAEQLTRAGDVDRAAFVLAELLGDAERAVALLEEHKRYRLAAEIAEARKLPPALAVRLWLLAGEQKRALQLACTMHCFAQAVSELERTHAPKSAVDVVRLAWSNHLAEAGNYLQAARTVREVSAAAPLASAWLAKARLLGGADGAAALIESLRHDALLEDTDAVVAEVVDLLNTPYAEYPVTAARQAALLTALAFRPKAFADGALPASAGFERDLAKTALRTLLQPLREGAYEPYFAPASILPGLLQRADDAVLAEDFRGLPAASRIFPHGASDSKYIRSERSVPLDFGAPVEDVAVMPDGRMVVAMGELGTWLLGRDGKVHVKFTEPSHRIVLSDAGDRAILVAFRGEERAPVDVCHRGDRPVRRRPRGGPVRLARVDLLAKRAEYWCHANLETFAEDFDGHHWIVATSEGAVRGSPGKNLTVSGSSVHAIDALAASDINPFQAVWSHTFTQSTPVDSLRRETTDAGPRVSALLRPSRVRHATVALFDAPNYRFSTHFPLAGFGIALLAVAPNGLCASFRGRRPWFSPRARICPASTPRKWQLAFNGERIRPLLPVASTRWALFPSASIQAETGRVSGYELHLQTAAGGDAALLRVPHRPLRIRLRDHSLVALLRGEGTVAVVLIADLRT